MKHEHIRSPLAAAVDLGARSSDIGAPAEDYRRALERQLAGRRPFVASYIIQTLARVGEVTIFIAVAAAIHALYVADYSAAGTIAYATLVAFAAVALAVSFHVAGLYRIAVLQRPDSYVASLIAALAAVFTSLLAFVFFTKAGEVFSRVWLASWMAASASLIIIFRVAYARLINRWNRDGRLARRAIVIGGGDDAARVIEALRGAKVREVSLIGTFDERTDERSPRHIAGTVKLGRIKEAVEFARTTGVDMVVVTLPFTAEDRLIEILEPFHALAADVRLSALSQKLNFRPRTYSHVCQVPMFDVFDRPISGWHAVAKWLEDRLIAAILVVFLAPLMALIAMAIKLESKGPVLFRQKRYGFNNELVEVYKFRSMYTDRCDADATRLVTRNDPRVTRVGRFIRRTSLDELPQLFNVLKGELSLVGPRPHATGARAARKLYPQAVKRYFARHKVKPGLTGWAQINGWRGETDTEEKIRRRVEHDLYYIENWSVLFDLYILAKTPFALVDPENTY